MAHSIQVEGLAEALATLKRVTNALEPRETEKTLLEGAKIIRDEAAARAPVTRLRDGSEGQLRKSIRAKIGKRRGKDFASAIAATDRKVSRVGHLVEYGHLLIKGGKGGKGGRQIGTVPAHPFFRPAFDSSKGRVLAVITEGLKAKLAGVLRR